MKRLLALLTAIAMSTALLAGCGEDSSKMDNVKVGGYITFGKYEQDDNDSNGKEAIEWLVLDAEGDRVLVISKYGLDAEPYNETMAETTWEEYFSSGSDRMCEPTAYAEGQGIYAQATANPFFVDDRAVRPAIWIDLNS